jgi:poly(ADP-ribose) glycohydrolase ARH3
MVGDVIGAVVEGESAAYLAKTYSSLDDILNQESVPEILGGSWRVGRFTDDTQMTLCVARWLLEDPALGGRELLRRFSEAYRPARRYGSGTRWILEAFPERQDSWEALSTIMFPNGSYGNGSAMRAAPIGLRFHRDLQTLCKVSEVASRCTHSHPLAIQGATLLATAVALATRATAKLDTDRFLDDLQALLRRLPWNSDDFAAALSRVRSSLSEKSKGDHARHDLGTGISALEAVPTAIYCFLQNADSFDDCLHTAIFAGGDTDTIACMAASISGAYLGVDSIPRRWLGKIREETDTPGQVKRLADALFTQAFPPGFAPAAGNIK